MWFGQVKHYYYCIAVLVVKGQEGTELLLASGVPDVDGERVSLRVVSIKTVVAGPKSIGDLFLEVAVQENLNETGFANVWVRENYVSHLAISP